MVEEALQHLTTLRGGRAKVTGEITSGVAEGVSDHARRVIDESYRTLRFTSHGFEES